MRKKSSATKEMLFRLASLALVGIGFIAGVAGADKEETKSTVTAIEDLIHDIKKVEEVDRINQGVASVNPKSDDQKTDNHRN
jgi:hypothetical protein